ncbi:MIP/aquaporin family protein [Streptomyces sp. NPDC002738]
MANTKTAEIADRAIPNDQPANSKRTRGVPGGLVGELAAEFIGTFLMILFGVGAIAQVVAGGTGDHDSIAWAWGIGVMVGIYAAGRISGAHLNPAVSIAMATYKGFSWRKVLPYSIAQTAGAFGAALIVRWNYSEIIAKFDPGHTIKSQGIFSTLPGNGVAPVSDLGAFRDQIIATAILMILIFAVTDTRNSAPLANLAPLIIALGVAGSAMGWAGDAGYAINPARDLGPRLATFITGYGGAFRDQYHDFYFWVPIAGPILGALIGGALYKYGIERFLPRSAEEPTPVAANS